MSNSKFVLFPVVDSNPTTQVDLTKFQDLKLDALYYNVRPHFGEAIALHMFYLYPLVI